jgi:pyruvoyl-dependent arginine decarboxylase (PvlArgDC)
LLKEIEKYETKMSGKIVRTSNVTQSAIVDKSGMWTTVIAAAVLILQEDGADKPLPPEQAKLPSA